MVQSVEMTKLVEKLNLRNLTPEISLTDRKVITQEINRPALQLTGYFDHFSSERVQIVGYVEYTYLMSKSREEKYPIYDRFFSSNIPCVIYTSRTEPEEDVRLYNEAASHFKFENLKFGKDYQPEDDRD